VVGTIADNGTILTGGTGIFTGNNGTINYATGQISLVATVPAHTTYNLQLSLAATTSGGYFTGNNTNFFNWTNWQPTDPATVVDSVSYLYMTNNVDPVTLFDGTNLSRPVFYINSAFTDYITTTLDVAIFQNRLLMIRPSILSYTSNALNQSIYYSALFNPFNFIKDVAGNGGQVTAATGDIIQCEEFLRNDIVVFFSNSTWLFRFTGSASDPFRFDKINVSKTTYCSYSSVAYDERCTALGNLGFIACDGTNVQRYDIPIIDFYETEISTQWFGQTFAKRYDNLNQTWMLYVSNGTLNPVVGGGAPGSDSALIYNFLENSWCTYSWSVPMSCLGTFLGVTGTTWAQLSGPAPADTWETLDEAWNSYGTQALSPILLAGDVNGNVYWMDNVTAVTDNGNPFAVNITSSRWNPIMNLGQKNQFAYIDVYYSVASTDPANPVQLVLTFYVDNQGQNASAVTRTLTLDGPPSSSFAFKRVYVNLIGEFIQMNIDTPENAGFKILGFILWVNPAGRLTGGVNV
jgi:hypothetical protein